MQDERRKRQVVQVLAKPIVQCLEEERILFDHIQEIKLRIGKPLIIIYRGKERMWKDVIVTKEEIKETLEYISNYSLYAYEHELKQGFITIEGGHRVGMAGQVIMEEGKIKNLKYISSINLRISHEVKNCADKIFPYITYNKQMYHTLLISPPRCGKTTLLRDIIRQVSDGNMWVKGCTVGVVDERSELGGLLSWKSAERDGSEDRYFRSLPKSGRDDHVDSLDGSTSHRGRRNWCSGGCACN